MDLDFWDCFDGSGYLGSGKIDIHIFGTSTSTISVNMEVWRDYVP